MLGLKKILYEFQYALIAVPIVLAIIAASKASIILSILSILLTVTDVAVLPVCKNNENVWTFFMIALTVTPINIKIIVHFIQGNINLFIGIVMGLLLYFIMLSIEEIIVGVIVRIIRSKQCDFDDYEFIDS